MGLKWAPRKKAASVPIAFVDIDKKTMEALGPWPGPKEFLGGLVKILKEGRVRVVGMDLPLDRGQPSVPSIELTKLKNHLEAILPGAKGAKVINEVLREARRLVRVHEGKRQLEESLLRSGRVILGYYGRRERKHMEAESHEALDLLSRNRLRPAENSVNSNRKFTVQDLILPAPELCRAALGLGHLNLAPNEFGVVRAHLPYIVYKGELLPSYPLRVALAYMGEKPAGAKVDTRKIASKRFKISLWKGKMLLSFKTAPLSLPHYSFIDILSAKKSPVSVQGKIVLIGLTDPGRTRSYLTPVYPSMSRSELCAIIVQDILAGASILRPARMDYFEVGGLFFLAGIYLMLFIKLREPWRLVLTLGLSGFALGLEVLFLSFLGIWLKAMYVAICFPMIYTALSFRRSWAHEKLAGETIEAHRLLGLNLQKQGLLDLALEKFLACPADPDTRDLIYHLGLDAEKRGWTKTALKAFDQLTGRKSFKDAEERLARLKASGPSQGIEQAGSRRGGMTDSYIKARGRVGRYEVLEELGKGTMGLVYKGIDPKIHRPLAIKIIRFSDEFDEDMVREIQQRFFREAEIAGRLSHTGIVTIYDVGEDEDLTYIAMEYLQGRDLTYYCKKENLLPLPKVLDVASKVADALDYAHRSHVIHRDIKPANIMLLADGGIKVTDFGIAKAVSSTRTKTGVILGTPNYMSPEQIMGHKIDQRTDIFSMGVLLFHLLTGELPFRGKNLSGLLFRITQGKHPSARKFNPKLPKACDQILDKAMAKRPEERFQNASDMAGYMRLLLSKINQVAERTREYGLSASAG